MSVVRRRSYRKVWFFAVVVFVAVGLFTFLTQSARVDDDGAFAANLGNFDAGYIISDYQMGNYTSMTEAEIQSFLDSQVSCDKGISYYNYLKATWPAFDWHFKDDHIVCMNEELFGDGETIGEGDTAAHIIWQAAQDYKINPQVLLVLLQKEQGLVTDSYPNTRQYRGATGYGCPDTAACSAKYYGFKNQVRNAASMFRTVLDGGWTNYPLGNNWIRYSAACSSGSYVNIRNLATSALYRYTPYQPNAAALAAGYGTVPGVKSETCAEYGNRNFYLYFEDWFSGITAEQVKITEISEYNVADGVYSILSSGDKTKTISVANESSSDGANVKTGIYRGAKIQQWKITKTDDYYTIQNVQTGKVLDIKSGAIASRTNIWQYSGNGSCAQRWKFAKNSDGSVVIHNACDLTYALDLQDGNTNLQLFVKTSYNNSNQNWVLSLMDDEDAKVADGVYSILSSGDKTKTISVANESSSDGANVKTGIYRGAKIQQWKITKTDDYYTIQNVQTGKSLGVADGGIFNNANVWQFTDDGTCAYRWKIVPNADGSVMIKNVCGILYVLDLQDGITNLQVYKKTSYENTNQKWILKNQDETEVTEDNARRDEVNDGKQTETEEKKSLDVSVYDGIYSILSSGDKTKTISVANESSSDGANVKTGIYRGAKIQQWKITKMDDYYTIQNVQTGKMLDIRSGTVASGTNIWQYTSNGSCAQRWKIMENEDGSVKIHNACNDGYVLDLQDGNTNIQLYRETSYDNTNQKWFLKVHSV